ncbi:unnamed protein product [Caenorhabditis bovis]|uniref:Uncharacterized protein n=1 Tax=Caenorhabditis bovis TaxID=2654633 RepID=A0A8S1EL74_9PELO|nr:unnamed protein product [Caenorhabditis bovis]
MRRKKSPPTINHRIFSMYSMTISFIYLLRVVFELATESADDIDVQWQVTECLFVAFGILISIALHNAYDSRVSLISISWVLWMFVNTLLALFVINSDIVQLVIERMGACTDLRPIDYAKLFIDILHFFNIPFSLYFICVFIISTKSIKKRIKKRRSVSEKPIIKKQFEVSNVFIGDEMVYYV